MSAGVLRRVGGVCVKCGDYFEAMLTRLTDTCWDCYGCGRWNNSQQGPRPRPENHKPGGAVIILLRMHYHAEARPVRFMERGFELVGREEATRFATGQEAWSVAQKHGLRLPALHFELVLATKTGTGRPRSESKGKNQEARSRKGKTL